MASSTGRRSISSRSLRAHRTPSGMPMTAQKNSEVSTSARVIMASLHTPITPKRVRVTRQRTPIFFPPTCQPKSVAIIMNIEGGIANSPN
ncbi:hypothetical protein D3C84_798980 [compost metagenome]